MKNDLFFSYDLWETWNQAPAHSTMHPKPAEQPPGWKMRFDYWINCCFAYIDQTTDMYEGVYFYEKVYDILHKPGKSTSYSSVCDLICSLGVVYLLSPFPYLISGRYLIQICVWMSWDLNILLCVFPFFCK